MFHLAIIEDDDLIRESLAMLLDSPPEISCRMAFADMETFLSTLNPDNAPDIVLSDIGLPGMSGIDGIRLIKERFPDIDILMLTVHEDIDKIFRSLCAGASGYLLKNTPFHRIRASVEALNRGEAAMSPEIAAKITSWFESGTARLRYPDVLPTDDERRVLAGIIQGLSYRLIGEQLNMSTESVQSHLKTIYGKLHGHTNNHIDA